MNKKDMLNWYLYEPMAWQKRVGYSVDAKVKCRFSVHETGRGVGFYQCQRNGKHDVEGFKLCGPHAKVLRAALERCDKD